MKARDDKRCASPAELAHFMAGLFAKCHELEFNGQTLEKMLDVEGYLRDQAALACAPSHALPKTPAPAMYEAFVGVSMDISVTPNQFAKGYEAMLAVCAPSATPLFTLDTAERVCFYEQEFYVLSNFSAFRLRWAGRSFDTSEHAYHWEKFHGHDKHQEKILTAGSAHEAFKYAERHKADRRQDWDAVKVDIMRDILRTKATQHEYVRRKLLQTGDRTLIENSWRDPFWGWGENRDGQNMLGKLWMEIRADLRSSDGGKQTHG